MKRKLLRKKIKSLKVDESIHLKTIVAADVSEAYVVWLNDYLVTKFTEQKYSNHSLHSVKEFVSQQHMSENNLLFGIFIKGLHVGNIKLGPIKFEHLSAEISYFIGEKEFWNKGIASKCVSTVVQYATAELNLKKINAGYYENNIGSAKVLEKCGFVIEGIRRSDVIFENKRISSILVGFIAK